MSFISPEITPIQEDSSNQSKILKTSNEPKEQNQIYSDVLNDNDSDLVYPLLSKPVANPIWLSVSEAAKLGGVQGKTIRRALTAQLLKYKIVGNRYFIDYASLIRFLHSSTKLRNKLNQNGIGQYVDFWRN